MHDELRAAYNAAYDKAAKEVDTWRCPRCLSEAQWPGNVHIEWGNPECHPCSVGGVQVKMTLVAIEPDRPVTDPTDGGGND